jgi:hypothetical protein
VRQETDIAAIMKVIEMDNEFQERKRKISETDEQLNKKSVLNFVNGLPI